MTTQKKKMRIDGVLCEVKTKVTVPWNEKSLLQHVDEDGKLDLHQYKSNASVEKQTLTMKLTKNR